MRWILLLASLTLVCRPLIALGEEEEEEEPEEESSPSAEEEEEPPAPPPSPNLTIPSDLPEKARKDLEEAIVAFQEAEKAETGRERLLKKAIEKFKAASVKAPKSPLPLYHLGIAYQLKRSFSEARRVLEKAVKLQPRFYEAIVELADVYVWQKDAKGSLAIYEKALEINPSYTVALDRKAFALIRLGRFKEAHTYLDQAQKAQPHKQRKRFAVQLEVEINGPKWKNTYVKETENYNVMTEVSQEFADEIAGHAELIRRAYDRVFPDIKKPERKYQVLVHADRAAYLKAGGKPTSGGYYDPNFRKLVLYRYPKKEDTLTTLYHEAFHQYIDDYMEQPPQWFNEGLGDYFGAYRYVRQGSRELMVCKLSRWRLPGAQFAAHQNEGAPASDLMVMTQRDFYGPKAAIYYSQAWAMIYFMIEGNKPHYKQTLVNYFRALHKGQDIDQAYQSTFGKLDMQKFDQEWRGYIKGLSN